MSESETKGRCRREFESHYADKQVIPRQCDWFLADAIDRLAADVAAVKEATLPQTTEERDCAIRERDEARQEREEARAEFRRLLGELAEARAEVERLRAQLAARPAAAGWLTEEERQILKNLLLYQWGGLGWLARVAPALRAILDRAGSPPVVEVPVLCPAAYGYDSPFHDAAYRAAHNRACGKHRDALDKAGVAWREVPRE